MAQGILIFGANGSGKTTLGRELAYILGYKHIDHEEYFFEKLNMPYTVERTFEKMVELMLADIKKSSGFVISAVTGDFGDEIESLYDIAFYLEAPLELRIERIMQRGVKQYGQRISEGGDMFEQQKEFIEYVKTHPQSKIEQYAKNLKCPMIRIDGTVDWRVTVKNIMEECECFMK
ncbi:MAG: AAA family ATPase [Oscillospiraceae bacterium]|nr:AAA family ATPase [Oscillospiraceae bacterium]